MPSVLIAGEDLPGSIGISFADGFRTLGWEVEFFPLSATGASHDGILARARARALSRVTEAGINRRLAARAEELGPDFSFVIKGHRLKPKTIKALRRSSALGVANFYPDDPFSIIAVNRAPVTTLREYSACLIFAKHLIPAYRSAGIGNVHYLPFARDPNLHSPSPGAEPEYDAVFVGNLDTDRVAWLEAIADYSIAIFGNLTRAAVPQGSRIRDAAFFGSVNGPELSRALARGRVSLNFMRAQNAGSHNMRSFESPACGAFTLSQRTPELLELFADETEIETFATPGELRERLTSAIANPEHRRVVAENGFRRVEHDVYARRVETILSIAAR